MAYPPDLKNLMKAVEKTRPKRIEQAKQGVNFPRMSLEEQEEIVRKFHPDYREEGKRALAVGPSKGYRVAHEFADILEAYSRVDPDRFDLGRTDYTCDVLVIGGGGGGTAAALLAQEAGADVLIATKLRHGDANTIMAEGGIQAATKYEKDSPCQHYLAVLGGGHFKNDPDLVRTLVMEAPYVISWLEKLGTMFSKFPDGRLKTLHGGGTSRKRMHSAGDITGCEIMRVIRDEARNRERIRVLEFSPAIELLISDKGYCCGAILYNPETEEYLVVRAKAVVLATGGCGRLHVQGFMTTNHYGATADGIALAYRAGVPLRFLHSVQYHPTGVVYPEQAEGILITEKFRGAGAHLLNIRGEQFVFERGPRDATSSAIIRECDERKLGVPTPTGRLGVWLDSPMLEALHGEGFVEKEFPGKHILFKRFGIDISKEPMLVYPTLHYQNGGIFINKDTTTNVPGLFAAGEVTGGVHGENRLMGNSLLDILVFGRIAGRNAAAFAAEHAEIGKPTLDHVRRYHRELEEAQVPRTRVSPRLLPDYISDKVKIRRLHPSILERI
ncbi:MAG TPA: FAD-binding protein [Proteobacteria bacterium]|nr:FAD-binding protein [Pseudomonadota bacterium]